MPLVKPQPQAGFQSQATQVQAAGAWFAGNLVRWRYGFLERMMGWTRLYPAPFAAMVRRLHAWTDLTNYKNLFVGSDAGLEILTNDTRYVVSRAGPAFGDPQSSNWYFGNLGQDGLVLVTNAPLEVLHPPVEDQADAVTTIVGAGPPATAPQVSAGMFIAMPQAQVILFGTEPILGSGTIDPLLVRFSDVGTYDTWSATVSNQAGSYRLSRGSKIIGGIQAPQTTLLLTDQDLWSMSYIGPPLVYGFTIMGTGCGLIAPHAICTLAKTTYWLTLKNVWQFGDTGIQPVPCSVWDYIFENLDNININKCHAAANSTTNEVAFYFPAKSEALVPGQNLLLNSQDFGAWASTGASAFLVVQFTTGYVYEPQYLAQPWFDDHGLGKISWFDLDVQTTPTATVQGPDGTLTAMELLEDTSNGPHQITQEIKKEPEQTIFTFSIYVHKNSTRNITLTASGTPSTDSAFVTFNPTTGLMVAHSATFPFVSNSWGAVTDDFATGLGSTGNGWLRYFMTFKTDDAPTLDLFVQLTSGTSTSYLGTGQYAYIWGAQLNIGNFPTEYIRTFASFPENETRYYIKYNTLESAWDSGILFRTAWLDNSIWGEPLGADENFLIQQHERGFDADDQPMTGAFVESGFSELGDGTMMYSIDQCHPDFKWFGFFGEVRVTLIAKNYPNEDAPVNYYGPFSMTRTTQYFNPRCRARYVAVRYDWSAIAGYSARVGAVTYRVKPAGRRP